MGAELSSKPSTSSSSESSSENSCGREWEDERQVSELSSDASSEGHARTDLLVLGERPLVYLVL